MPVSCELVALKSLGNPHHNSGGELYYHCPNHDDHHPSLKINLKKDCFLCGPCAVGGNGWRLAAFLGHFDPNEKKAVGGWLRDHGIEQDRSVRTPKRKPPETEWHEVAAFYYTPTLRNVRSEETVSNGHKPAKKFQFQSLENGSWVPGAGGQHKPLYVNAALRDAEQVSYAVGFEGEAKCDIAGEFNIPGFSYKFMDLGECAKLTDLEVILWPDADSPGEKQAKVAAKLLLDSGHPRAIRIIVPPLELPLSGDIVDAVRSLGWDRQKIAALLQSAKPWPPPPVRASIRLSEIEDEPIDWLWTNRLPVGAITLLDGDPGTGKSMLAIDITARVTQGMPCFGETVTHPPATVIFLSSEDSLKQTLKPRLRAAGADLSKVVTIPYVPDKPGQLTFSRIPRDLELLGKTIEEEKAKLVVFDVLVSYIPAELSTQRDQDVRLALSPLAALANRTGVSCLATRHLNKNIQASAMYRGGGSIAIIGAARCSLLLARSPDNPENRTLAVVKSNLGIIPPALNFTIRTKDRIPVVEWLGESEHKPEDLLVVSQPDQADLRSSIEDGVEFLKAALENGPVLQSKIEADARNVCISRSTLYRAKKALSIDSYKKGLLGQWLWGLPKGVKGGSSHYQTLQDDQE